MKFLLFYQTFVTRIFWYSAWPMSDSWGLLLFFSRKWTCALEALQLSTSLFWESFFKVKNKCNLANSNLRWAQWHKFLLHFSFKAMVCGQKNLWKQVNITDFNFVWTNNSAVNLTVLTCYSWDEVIIMCFIRTQNFSSKSKLKNYYFFGYSFKELPQTLEQNFQNKSLKMSVFAALFIFPPELWLI